ncbi:hypothetical protein [Helicobacter sp. 11S02596-1]|uniref:hypothetical protein n=1 Tax=Helicobacter sp. 11S02596-1 TaxID=1476194 RepID=UPI000BA55770|nr:hypothetical protein [Helicobacter sp. 11S02596-1]PAF41363.1 hypothetical protein BJI48_08715 [Helicobacter sp. 11S02596-1]
MATPSFPQYGYGRFDDTFLQSIGIIPTPPPQATPNFGSAMPSATTQAPNWFAQNANAIGVGVQGLSTLAGLGLGIANLNTATYNAKKSLEQQKEVFAQAQKAYNKEQGEKDALAKSIGSVWSRA